MTELQQAAQQALKILDSEFTTLNGEFCRWCDGRLNAKHNCALEQTITALRAALAEPQSTHSEECWRWHHECAIARIEETEELREALKTALAESEKLSEPVAWMYTGIKSDDSEHGPHLVWRPEYMDAMSASKGTKATPLYTAPPKRDPLTDEQISDLWHQSGEQPFKFARMLLK